MRKRLGILLVMASMIIPVFALNLGVAFAHEPPTSAVENAWAPVGQNAFDPDHPGKFKGFAGVNPDTNGNAVAGITHNPLCPLHAGSH